MGVCRRILGRGLLLPRVVPRGIRGRGTGRIRTGRDILVGRLLLPGPILASIMMVLLGLVMAVLLIVMLSGTGMMLAGMFVRVAG